MSDWKTVRLDQVVELQRGHDLPQQDRINGEIPVLGSNGIVGFHDQARYSGPGVTIGRSGVIGGATFVEGSYWPLNTCLFVKDFLENDVRWVYYWLKSADFTAMDSGSAQPSLNRNYIANFPVILPPRHEQKAIAEVLGALDDKIAANTKLAATADEWVRTEYDRIANLSDEKCTIADLVAHRRNAADPSTIEVHVPYVGLEHIPRRSMWLEAHGSSGEVSSNKSHFQSGDILFGKLRPYFHKIVTAPTSGICSTDVLVLTSIDESLSGYALASLAHDSVVQAVTAASEGTRMPRTNWKDLSNVEVPWPGQMAAAAFSAKVQTVRSSVIGVLAENQTLATTRDVLLPQLMSGKLRVKQAEEIVAAAI
ncbi:restriction endonuclease subunit S [Glutamicibacter ardleyensis]|uniref:restriction endonuclease subunit S n=1 Tax=Glutamicibacter ardleyensis TaxID=225894 RepID=UPI003FD2ECD7